MAEPSTGVELSVSEYTNPRSEVDVEMLDELASITACSDSFVETALSYLSAYSPAPSEVSVEFGGALKGLTDPLPDFDALNFTDADLVTCASSAKVIQDGPELHEGYLSQPTVDQHSEADHLESYLNTATSDVETGKDALDSYVQTATAELYTALQDGTVRERQHLDSYLNTATADVNTGRDPWDSCLNTATADVNTGRDHLESYLNTATADVLTGRPTCGQRDQMNAYLNTAVSDVLTGRDQLDSFVQTATADVLTAQSVYWNDEHFVTGRQRTDSCETGQSLSVSEYSEPDPETSVEMVELYPQAHKSLLHLPERFDIDTMAPPTLDFTAMKQGI